jgi:hypothetical protein
MLKSIKLVTFVNYYTRCPLANTNEGILVLFVTSNKVPRKLPPPDASFTLCELQHDNVGQLRTAVPDET